jgi:hypothetical protein
MGQAVVMWWRSRKQQVWNFVVGAGLVGVECPLVNVDAVMVLVLVVAVVMLLLRHGGQ